MSTQSVLCFLFSFAAFCFSCMIMETCIRSVVIRFECYSQPGDCIYPQNTHDKDISNARRCTRSVMFCIPATFVCRLPQVEFKAGKPPVLTFFDKASGEEAESINLEKLALDEVRLDVVLEDVIRCCAVKQKNTPSCINW